MKKILKCLSASLLCSLLVSSAFFITARFGYSSQCLGCVPPTVTALGVTGLLDYGQEANTTTPVSSEMCRLTRSSTQSTDLKDKDVVQLYTILCSRSRALSSCFASFCLVLVPWMFWRGAIPGHVISSKIKSAYYSLTAVAFSLSYTIVSATAHANGPDNLRLYES